LGLLKRRLKQLWVCWKGCWKNVWSIKRNVITASGRLKKLLSKLGLWNNCWSDEKLEKI
jgi:hypothetical protein